MSIKTWKQEFYPTNAEDNTMNDVVALEHCICKWEGLTKENLQKHNLKKLWCEPDIVENDETVFVVDQNTCALCQIYFSKNCTGCPLIRLGFAPCGSSNRECEDPYSVFYEDNDAQPMIEALKKTMDFVKNSS